MPPRTALKTQQVLPGKSAPCACRPASSPRPLPPARKTRPSLRVQVRPGFVLISYCFRLKMLLWNKITFMAAKKRARMMRVSTGFLGARVASSIMGKPKTMAGKF